MKNYKIIWFPSMRHLIYTIRYASAEYWNEQILPFTTRIDYIPLYMTTAILQSLILPFIIVKKNIDLEYTKIKR